MFKVLILAHAEAHHSAGVGVSVDTQIVEFATMQEAKQCLKNVNNVETTTGRLVVSAIPLNFLE